PTSRPCRCTTPSSTRCTRTVERRGRSSRCPRGRGRERGGDASPEAAPAPRRRPHPIPLSAGGSDPARQSRQIGGRYLFLIVVCSPLQCQSRLPPPPTSSGT